MEMVMLLAVIFDHVNIGYFRKLENTVYDALSKMENTERYLYEVKSTMQYFTKTEKKLLPLGCKRKRDNDRFGTNDFFSQRA